MRAIRTAFRRAVPDDADGVLDCLRSAFEPFRARYTKPAYQGTVLTRESIAERFNTMTVFVAEDGSGTVIGTIACCRVTPEQGLIRGMAVLPEWQGRGVAEQLVRCAENELRKNGCTSATLGTTEVLARAMRFYERMGYRRTGRSSDFYGMPLHEYAKRLT